MEQLVLVFSDWRSAAMLEARTRRLYSSAIVHHRYFHLSSGLKTLASYAATKKKRGDTFRWPERNYYRRRMLKQLKRALTSLLHNTMKHKMIYAQTFRENRIRALVFGGWLLWHRTEIERIDDAMNKSLAFYSTKLQRWGMMRLLHHRARRRGAHQSAVLSTIFHHLILCKKGIIAFRRARTNLKSQGFFDRLRCNGWGTVAAVRRLLIKWHSRLRKRQNAARRCLFAHAVHARSALYRLHQHARQRSTPSSWATVALDIGESNRNHRAFAIHRWIRHTQHSLQSRALTRTASYQCVRYCAALGLLKLRRLIAIKEPSAKIRAIQMHKISTHLSAHRLKTGWRCLLTHFLHRQFDATACSQSIATILRRSVLKLLRSLKHRIIQRYTIHQGESHAGVVWSFRRKSVMMRRLVSARLKGLIEARRSALSKWQFKRRRVAYALILFHENCSRHRHISGKRIIGEFYYSKKETVAAMHVLRHWTRYRMKFRRQVVRSIVYWKLWRSHRCLLKWSEYIKLRRQRRSEWCAAQREQKEGLVKHSARPGIAATADISHKPAPLHSSMNTSTNQSLISCKGVHTAHDTLVHAAEQWKARIYDLECRRSSGQVSEYDVPVTVSTPFAPPRMLHENEAISTTCPISTSATAAPPPPTAPAFLSSPTPFPLARAPPRTTIPDFAASEPISSSSATPYTTTPYTGTPFTSGSAIVLTDPEIIARSQDQPIVPGNAQACNISQPKIVDSGSNDECRDKVELAREILQFIRDFQLMV